MTPEQALQLLAEAAYSTTDGKNLHRQFYEQAVQVLTVAIQRIKAHAVEKPKKGVKDE